jgi:hypothetical protein
MRWPRREPALSAAPVAQRLVRAYNASSAALNLVRAFTQGGYADLRQVHSWNVDFVGKSGSAAAMVLHGVALDNSHRGDMPEYRHLRLAELDPRSLFCEASEVARRMERGIGARVRAEMTDSR